MNVNVRPSESQLDCFGMTDVGKIRESNQDHFLIASMKKSLDALQASFSHDRQNHLTSRQGHLFIVADGMGGHVAGDIAAEMAIKSFADYVLSRMHWHLHSEESQEKKVLDAFVNALTFCQNGLHEFAKRVPECKGMGTTLTVAYLAWPKLFVLHAGDSRCYLNSGQSLRQLTTDHTVKQRLIDEGQITHEQASRSPFASCIWNAIGGNDDAVEPQLVCVELKPGDTIFLCSDGLTKHLSDQEIATQLQSGLSAEQACRQLVQATLDAGGSDNVTVVVARLDYENRDVSTCFFGNDVQERTACLEDSTHY